MTLDPQLLARLGPLQIRARAVMEGVLSGLHQSKLHGQSVEFSEHKEYAPGDEIKHIDWRAYAKLDKHYVKRFEMETNLRALLVVDASGSMAYGRGAMKKLDYAKVCAGALAALLSRQGDQVGLVLAGVSPEAKTQFAEGVRSFLPFSAAHSHVQEMLRQLEVTEGTGPTRFAQALDFAAEKAGRRALVVALGDLFDTEAVPALKRLRSRRHDVLCLHVLDREELEFPFDDPTRFLSMEDDQQIDAQPRQIRESYLSELKRFLEETRRELGRADVEYELVASDEAPDRVLLRVLRRREGGAKGSR
ncbi:MAG: DUF58 domain-containing protein [Deltaproteobacteria bacterium]|nr:DUF58 domain-containing protein [Deltaproteobacteria bacterium]